jgi:ribonuclease P protein component
MMNFQEPLCLPVIIHHSSFIIQKMDFRFRRTEHLKSEKIISQLFKSGKSFSCYPMRLVYSEIDPLSISTPNKLKPTECPPILFSLSVSKKNFKHAVDRNLLRRRVREAYRLHKHWLYTALNDPNVATRKHFAFMLIYTAKEILPYAEIEKGIRKMVSKFKAEAM